MFAQHGFEKKTFCIVFLQIVLVGGLFRDAFFGDPYRTKRSSSYGIFKKLKPLTPIALWLVGCFLVSILFGSLTT